MDTNTLSTIRATLSFIEETEEFSQAKRDLIVNTLSQIIEIEEKHNARLMCEFNQGNMFDFKGAKDLLSLLETPTPDVKFIIKYLKRALKAFQVQDGWKSVLLSPIRKGYYLAYCQYVVRPQYGFYAVLEFDGTWENSDIIVTHWQELPSAPRDALPPL